MDERNALWMRNKAGLSHSHQHGFGLMNAWRMVSVAKVWSHYHCICSIIGTSVAVALCLRHWTVAWMALLSAELILF